MQNGDDAGATEISFCLDNRSHNCDSLAYPLTADYMGTALLAFNNAIFREQDFISIQRLGDSIKKTEDEVRSLSSTTL